MAMIHVNRGATSLGAFPEDQVREGIRAGRFLPSDLGWREGMASWQPLSQFSEFAADIGAAPGAPSQAPATSTITPPAAGSTAGTPAPRSGLPWDQRQEKGFFNAFIETLQMVLTRPSDAFTAMKREGGFGEPLIYALIGGCIGVVFWFILALGLNSLGILGNRGDAMGSMMGMTVSWMVFVLRLIGVAIAPFVFGGLVHLSLMLVGGAKQSFETTFRVIAFSQGSTMPLQLVPCCGGLVAFVWWLVANCVGIARAHEIDTGSATLAVILPLIICCGGGVLILFMFGGLAALGHNWNP
jgi:hypothetical protein